MRWKHLSCCLYLVTSFACVLLCAFSEQTVEQELLDWVAAQGGRVRWSSCWHHVDTYNLRSTLQCRYTRLQLPARRPT